MFTLHQERIDMENKGFPTVRLLFASLIEETCYDGASIGFECTIYSTVRTRRGERRSA